MEHCDGTAASACRRVNTGKDSVEVQSPDGRVKVSVPAGSFNEQ